jgi:type II secretory pathway pseudopilin PulG
MLELLVVALIIGILAAILLPSFLDQTGKAGDAQAKALLRTAQTAAEASATDNGDYEKVSAAELNAIEPTIRIAASTTEAYLSAATGAKATYSLTAKAINGDEFTIKRNAAGETAHECLSPVTKTGCSGSETGSW